MFLPMKVACSFIKGGFPRSAGILCPTSKRWISYGRLLVFLKNKDTVMLTFCDGSIKFITPFPAEEFCRYFKRKQEDFLEKTGGL